MSKINKIKNKIEELYQKIDRLKEEKLNSDLSNYFIIFNCDEDGNMEILEKEDALININENVYSYNNCSYVAMVLKSSDENIQYINVYNLIPEYDYVKNKYQIVSLTGEFEPICKIWNTIYDSRGVEFVEKGCIQEEIIFHIGKLCEEVKTRYTKYLKG